MLYPALALLVVGGVGLVWLSFGTHEIGGVAFSVQTMLACATAVIAGVQTVGLAIVSRSYAAHLGCCHPASGWRMPSNGSPSSVASSSV